MTAEYLAVRAARSASPAEAEADYAMIASAHRNSRQRENALLRLAQFQITRGALDEGLRSLDQLGNEFSSGATVADRFYWAARAHLAKGDTAAACAAAKNVPTAARQRLGADFSVMEVECVAHRSRVQTADSLTRSDDSTRSTTRAANGPPELVP